MRERLRRWERSLWETHRGVTGRQSVGRLPEGGHEGVVGSEQLAAYPLTSGMKQRRRRSLALPGALVRVLAPQCANSHGPGALAAVACCGLCFELLDHLANVVLDGARG
jgi:hypothetical protein